MKERYRIEKKAQRQISLDYSNKILSEFLFWLEQLLSKSNGKRRDLWINS